MKKETPITERCAIISTVQKTLGGKWKIEILYYIGFQDIHRFGELITRRSLPRLNIL